MPRPMPPKNGKNGVPQKAKKGTLLRLIKMLLIGNKKLLAVILICLAVTSVTGVASSFFLAQLLKTINRGLELGGGESALNEIMPALTTIFVAMGGVYLINILCAFLYTRLGAILTQRFLHQTRTEIFNKM